MNEPALLGLRGPVAISCPAPYGVGGLGRHLQEIVDFCRARGIETQILSQPPKAFGRIVGRFSPKWGLFLEAIAFDAAIAKSLPKVNAFIGFSGLCLYSLTLSRANVEELILVSPVVHVNFGFERVQAAWAYAPVEPFPNLEAHRKRILREYEIADKILYASDYVRDSFLRENVAAEKLERFNLTVDTRFHRPRVKNSSRFKIVSIGALNCLKGTAVLIDAFEKFDGPNAELILIGNSGTRQMRRYLQTRLATDQRIRIAPGDPLPHLLDATALVHASFQDGFGYGPMEALACGVPVIVTEHTGMKEHVREGQNGFVIRAGDPAAILEALKKIRP